MSIARTSRFRLFERGHAFRKAVKFDRYLRQLISVYTSPFLQPKYDYSELMESRREKAAEELDYRFAADHVIMIRALLSAFSLEPSKHDGNVASDKLLDAFKNYLTANQDNRTDLQEMAVETLAVLCEHPVSAREQLPEKLRLLLSQSIEPVPTKTSKYGSSSYSPPSRQAQLVASILDQLIEEARVPRAYEYDHLDDIAPIVESRYAGTSEKHLRRSAAILNALKRLVTCDRDASARELSSRLRNILGENHPYIPKRGQAHPDIKKIIPELFDELVAIKATENLPRFKEINREYSFRQRVIHQEHGNPWGLPLLAGLEEDHHLMLRTLLSLRQKGAILPADEVLVVGPRYADELMFFRKHLDLPKTIGLDLFENRSDGIVAGDMHDTGFESHRFKLIYCAGTLNYAYDLRKVIAEFARILKRPGYLCLMDAGDRVNGVDPLGRSDPMNLETLIGCFYRYKIMVHAQDKGRTPFPSMFLWWPCVVIEIQE